jgi:hypothetical protein
MGRGAPDECTPAANTRCSGGHVPALLDFSIA